MVTRVTGLPILTLGPAGPMSPGFPESPRLPFKTTIIPLYSTCFHFWFYLFSPLNLEGDECVCVIFLDIM